MDAISKICVVISLLICSVFYGQYRVLSKKYDVTSGLIANDVQALCLDKEGVLWIGSTVGISKIINGVVELDQEINDYSFTNITSIVEDPDQGIWIASYGQGVLYKKEDKILSFGLQENLISDRVKTLEIFQGKLYVGTTNGISIIDLKTHQIHNPKIELELYFPFEVSDFFVYEDQIYATTINNGVCLIEGAKVKCINPIKGVFTGIPYQGMMFYATQKGLIVQDFLTQETIYQKNISNIKCFEIINGELFIISSGFFDNQGGVYKWDNFQVEQINQSIKLEANSFLSMIYDNNHEFLYIGSSNSGLFQIDMFSALTLDTTKEHVMALGAIKDTVFLFSNKGLDLFREGKQIKHVDIGLFKDFQQKNFERLKHIATKENYFLEIDYSIDVDHILFFKAIEHQNSIWVSSNIGLFQLDSSGELIHYYNIFTVHFEFYNGQLIEVMPYQGVRIYSDLKNFKYTNYLHFDSKDIPREIVSVVKMGDTIYFGSAFDGLFSYNEEQGFVSLFEKGWFKPKRIKRLSAGPKGILYVATDTNEIYALQTNSPFYYDQKVIDREQIMGSDISFISWNLDKIIIGTNKGLTVFKEDGVFYFDQEQGFDPNKITTYHKKGNILYLGTLNGLYTIDTYYFQTKSRELKVKISQILVNGKKTKLSQESFKAHQALILPYNMNSLQINFSVDGAKFPKKLYYQYRLKPDGNWRKVRESRVELHYLESGTYPIELKIRDYDSGYEILRPLLFVKIRVPYYRTVWFIAGCILGISVLTFIFYRNQILQLKRKQSVKARKLVYDKRLAEVKLLAIRSQMNAHFIFNVLSSIQFYILKGSQDQAFDYLGKFAHLIRESLNLSTKERISLAREIEYLTNYVEIENMRLDGRVVFEVTVLDNIDIEQIFLPPMLLQPFIENAMVHAFPLSIENPKLELHIYKLNQEDLCIVIQDNGIGGVSKVKKKHNYKSKGMSIVRQRMSLIQKYLEQDIKTYTSDKGSRVELILKKVIK